MRYTSNVPGFESNFLEVSEHWTRKEVRQFYAVKGEEYLKLIRSKLVAIHLDTESGVPIDTPDKFTDENTDGVDYLVWRWVSIALNRGIDDLYALGEETARLWLAESAS